MYRAWTRHQEPDDGVTGDHREQIDALGSAISTLVARRAGRLVAVSVTRPAAVPEALLRDLVGERLSAAGLDFVDVSVLCEEGPVRLLSVEFEA